MNSLLLICLLLAQVPALPKARQEFHWDWHRSQSLFGAPSLKDIKMPQPDRAALARVIEDYVGPPDQKNPELASKDQVRQAVLNANIKAVVLDQDGKQSEVVAQVQEFCSADGNCPLWFFQRTPHGYRLLLDAIGQSFNVQKTATNGFSDVVVNMHGSATDLGLKVYRYARGRYWRSACYDADWAPLENGVVRQFKEPRVTPTRCH